MPTKIADRGIATAYNKLESQHATDPNVKVGQQQVMELLAQIGDKAGGQKQQDRRRSLRPLVDQTDKIGELTLVIHPGDQGRAGASW